MKLLIIGIMALVCHDTFSQYRGANWVFGDSVGLSFMTDTPSIFFSGIFTYEPSATISDADGNLLFYTNGAKVWNNNHEIMALGDHLNIGGASWPLSTITQGVIIIPDPGNDYEYYIFQLDNPVYYSKVNMLNFEGLGSVYIQNEALYEFNKMEKMTAVKHGNGRDWWLIIAAYPEGGTSSFGSPLLYYEYLVSTNGISGPFIKEGLNYEDQNINVNRGQMKLNSQGNMIAVSHGRSIVLYNFNRCTGAIDLFAHIDSLFTGAINDCIYGLEFSLDGTKLYASKSGGETYGISRIFQFDLSSDSLTESELILHQEITGFHFCAMQIALNGKIYITMPSNSNFYSDTLIQNTHISVIHNPNEAGSACNYEHLGQNLGGKKTTYSLPNMPNYNLGPLEQSECDTLSTSMMNLSNPFGFKLYPNPASGYLVINRNAQVVVNPGSGFTVCIYDAFNREVFLKHNYTAGNTLHLPPLSGGVYMVQVWEDNNLVHAEKIVITQEH